jgi:hypothetical protein
MENDFTIDEILAIDLKPKRKAEPIKKMKCPKCSGKKRSNNTSISALVSVSSVTAKGLGKGFTYKVK